MALYRKGKSQTGFRVFISGGLVGLASVAMISQFQALLLGPNFISALAIANSTYCHTGFSISWWLRALLINLNDYQAKHAKGDIAWAGASTLQRLLNESSTKYLLLGAS